MTVDKSKHCLVRGYVVYGQWGSSCIGLDLALDSKNVRVGVAYTLWHRTDEPKIDDVLESELNNLAHCYTRLRECDGVLCSYEYRPYSN
jgi:hypothetical protein